MATMRLRDRRVEVVEEDGAVVVRLVRARSRRLAGEASRRATRMVRLDWETAYALALLLLEVVVVERAAMLWRAARERSTGREYRP